MGYGMCVKVIATEDQLKSVGILDSQVLDMLKNQKVFEVSFKKEGVMYGLAHPKTGDTFVSLPVEYCQKVGANG